MRHRTLLLLLAVLLAMPAARAITLDQKIAEGDAAYERHDYDAAIGYYRSVRDDYRHGLVHPRMGDAMNWAGNASMNTGHYVEALEYYTAGAELARQSRNSRLYRDLLSNIGIVFGIFRDFERAAYYFDRAYAEARQQRDTYLMSIAITNLAAAYCRLGDTDKALPLIELQQQNPLPQPGLQTFFLSYNRALAALSTGDAHGAIYNLQQALSAIDEHALASTYRTDVYNALGEAYTQLGQLDKAIGYYRLTTAIGIGGHAQEQLRDAYEGLEHLYMLKEERDSALTSQSQYIALTDSFFNQRRFNAAKDGLMKLEEQMESDSRQTLTTQITRQWLVIAVISLLLVVVVAFAVAVWRTGRNLRSAHRMLMRKHDELVRQQEETNQLRDTYLSALHKDDLTPDPAPRESTPEGFALSQERREQLLKDIVEVMEQTDIIAAPDFNLHTLAKLAGSNTKYVSTVINDTYQKNFKTLLNEYRIREACRRFADHEHYGNMTIQGIASDLGYNSTNGFITAFKKIIGMTPSVYIRLLKESANN
ncbi:MAG: helix-turn-helix domain-containing protein [Prevotella sp.]|nr:helix-turn-helix domain-containing protein [Prevotella sp.]